MIHIYVYVYIRGIFILERVFKYVQYIHFFFVNWFLKSCLDITTLEIPLGSPTKAEL